MKSKQITFARGQELLSDDNTRNQEVIYYKKARLERNTGYYIKLILISVTSISILVLFEFLFETLHMK